MPYQLWWNCRNDWSNGKSMIKTFFIPSFYLFLSRILILILLIGEMIGSKQRKSREVEINFNCRKIEKINIKCCKMSCVFLVYVLILFLNTQTLSVLSVSWGFSRQQFTKIKEWKKSKIQTPLVFQHTFPTC